MSPRWHEPGVDHICVAAGEGPFVVSAVGGRVGENVEVETTSPREAYAAFRKPEPMLPREEFLGDRRSR